MRLFGFLKKLGISSSSAKLKSRILEHERLSELKDEFLSIVSHEMRTPLTILKGAISNLKIGVMGPLTDKQMRVVDIASSNIDRLSRIINDLLDLSRLESGKAKLHPKAVSLGDILREQASHLSFVPNEKKVAIKLEISHDLPSADADHDMMEQVVSNLFANALRFAKAVIRVRAVVENGIVRISIFNDGPHIAEDRINNLFTKFVQLGRVAGGEGYKGTGLGLAICKEILTKHGGRIWVENTPEGPEFYFTVPVFDAAKNLVRKVQLAIEDSLAKKEPLSLIAVSSRKAEEAPKLWDVIRTRFLRATDTLEVTGMAHRAVIVAKADRDGVLRMQERLKQLVGAEFEVTYACATYPESGQTAEGLVGALKP